MGKEGEILHNSLMLSLSRFRSEMVCIMCSPKKHDALLVNHKVWKNACVQVL